MPSLLTRARAALAAFMRPTLGQIQVAASTVRPHEVNDHYGRTQRYEFAHLMAMFTGTVKVAASRNAMGIASNKLRVYRQGSGYGKSAMFDGRPVNRARLRTLRKNAGPLAAKALSDTDDIEEITDPKHPLVAILQRPNPFMGQYELLESTGLCLGLSGNYYWKIAYDPMGTPVEVWGLLPQFVHVIPDRDRFISGYVYGRGTEVEQTFEAKDVVHFRYPNPTGDPYYGRGDLAACVAEARLGFQFVAFAQAMLDNGVQPGLVVTGQFTEQQRTQLEVSLQAKHGGVHNAGRHFVISGTEVDVTTLNLGEKEMAFLASSERIDQVVFNCFDVPMELGRMKPGGLSGNTNAVYEWQTGALRPRGQRIEDTINRHLVPMFGDPSLCVAFDPWVDDEDVESTRLVVEMWNADMLTKNEARVEAGWDAAADETGDQYKSQSMPKPDPFGLGGLGGGDGNNDSTDAARSAKRTDGGDAGDNREGKSASAASVPERGGIPLERKGGVESVSHPERGGLAAGMALTALILPLTPPAKALDLCCTRQPPVARKNDSAPSIIAVTERQLEAALRAWFDGLRPDIIQSITGSGLGMDIATNAVVRASLAETVNRTLEGVFRAGLATGVADVSARISPQALQDALTSGAQEYLRTHTARLIQTVPETLEKNIRRALADGVQAGETIQELQGRVQDVMDGASNWGAERIARTETARAYLGAREKAWEESGIVKAKKWLLSSDPCPLCEAMAQKHNEAALGQAFLPLGATLEAADGSAMVNDYMAVMTPPAHPACRCSMAAVFE